jgi:hypothetical protein
MAAASDLVGRLLQVAARVHGLALRLGGCGGTAAQPARVAAEEATELLHSFGRSLPAAVSGGGGGAGALSRLARHCRPSAGEHTARPDDGAHGPSISQPGWLSG